MAEKPDLGSSRLHSLAMHTVNARYGHWNGIRMLPVSIEIEANENLPPLLVNR